MASSVSSIIREEEGGRLRVAYQRMKITKRITQAEIARACGWTSASTFNRVLSGKIPLTLDSVTKLAAALGVNPASIPQTHPGEGYRPGIQINTFTAGEHCEGCTARLLG